MKSWIKTTIACSLSLVTGLVAGLYLEAFAVSLRKGPAWPVAKGIYRNPKFGTITIGDNFAAYEVGDLSFVAQNMHDDIGDCRIPIGPNDTNYPDQGKSLLNQTNKGVPAKSEQNQKQPLKGKALKVAQAFLDIGLSADGVLFYVQDNQTITSDGHVVFRKQN